MDEARSVGAQFAADPPPPPPPDTGSIYVFAGSAGAAATGSFSLPCVGDTTATVVGESRTVPVTNGSFTDGFADGNAIHIYRIDGVGSDCGLPGAD
jgi:hypothetical protein